MLSSEKQSVRVTETQADNWLHLFSVWNNPVETKGIKSLELLLIVNFQRA